MVFKAAKVGIISYICKEIAKGMTRRQLLFVLLLGLFSITLTAQEGPVFVNEGETVVYHLSRDPQGQKGTVSDALQNVPGVKVDTEGHISLRGVSEVEIFIDGKPSHFDEESQKNYLQQVSAKNIERIEFNESEDILLFR